MRNSLQWAAALALSILAAPVAQAATTTYDCTVQSLEGRGFIRDRVMFTIDTDANRAAVVDDIVYRVYEQPVEARLQQLDNGQYRLKWDVKNLKSGSSSFNLVYTMQYRPKSQKFNLRAQVRGYDNRPFGDGTCRIVTGQSLLK